MPEGFRLAFPIFRLEDDCAFNGWTALTHAAAWLLGKPLPRTIASGCHPRRALEAALRACERDPDDTDAAEAGHESMARADDERRHAALLGFFRANAHLFDHAQDCLPIPVDLTTGSAGR